MSGKAVSPTQRRTIYRRVWHPCHTHAICCVHVAAWRWLRMAWGGCVGMAGMPYPPINTSAPTDADVCADRCGCLRRPIRMSAPTDADVCVDRCGCLRRPMRTMQGGLSCSGKWQS
ncbi:hypothetical protein [Leyella stercorea]|uniref:hypothetical protein n=1 Tax=Leyella stercorea TaxID=363265 RepID=UPI00266B882F|nr:hypothetical protein [Leyella stercorea]